MGGVVTRAMIVALLVAGCSSPSAESVAHTEDTVESLTAVLSCSVNGAPIGISACLTAGGSDIGGSLKTTIGSITKQYTDYDIHQMGVRQIELDLEEPFELTAQANADEGFVLRLEIKNGSQIVFQDETSEFGVIHADSDM